MKHYTLYNWSVRAPIGLTGQVKGHPTRADGSWVKYSGELTVTSDGQLASYSSIITLGEVDPVYADLYPNARERLLARMRGERLDIEEAMKEPGQ